ncbi:MAG: hypothetical protein WEA24_02345 [Gemmatimonadota bacterium]
MSLPEHGQPTAPGAEGAPVSAFVEVPVMARVRQDHYRAYGQEAERRGVSVRELIEQTVNCLLDELEREENECQEALRAALHPAVAGRGGGAPPPGPER